MNRQKREIIKLEDGWSRIEKGGLQAFLDRVEACNTDELNSRPNPVDEMTEIIDIVFQMCIQREPNNYSAEVYKRVADTTTNYFRESFLTALRAAQSRSQIHFLQEFAQRWKQCEFTVGGMKRMFNYLNRYHVPNSDGLLELEENGYNLFKQIVFDTLKVDLRNAILLCIEDERNGNRVQRDLLRDCVYVFVALGRELKTQFKGADKELNVYKDDLQKDLLSRTHRFYNLASERWLQQMSTPEYLRRVDTIQIDEMDRVSSYLHESSRDELMETLRQTLLQQHQRTLLEQDSGLVRMLDEQASEDLERLYRLFKDVNSGIGPIATTLKDYICELGAGFIDQAKELEESKDQKKNLDLISKIIALHERFHSHVVDDFNNDPELSKALRDAFEEFINKQNYVIRYLAKYANKFMIKGGSAEGKSDAEKEDIMNHIKMIYGYFRDKDVFEREYQHYLAYRLLNNQSSSDAMEQKMIGLLKQECGYHWAQKLEDMFKDMQTSKELMREFKREHRSRLDFELGVAICEFSKWPDSTDQKKMDSVSPPGELEIVAEQLRNFYENKHAGRRFFVRWDKGNGEMLVTFNRKTNNRKFLIFNSTYQIMVMLMFNRGNPESKGKPIWKYHEIQRELGIPDPELQAALKPLYHPKLAALQKRPGGPKIEPNHMFRLNAKFKNPQKRITVPTFTVKRNVADNTIPQEIVNQRRHQMDAAIVRIMKARRQLTVQELLAEVAQQLQARFQPDARAMKKRMEVLITQEYLMRDEDSRNTLHYVQ